jgi:sensor histidine kinase regulating citrate/malate metabolism
MVENKDAALSYIKQLQGMQTTRIFTVHSHHPIIDAVLNQKYQQAQEHDIDVQMQVNDLSSVSIYTDHLVVLLSNLLDNAIEACLRLADCRAIQCTIILSDSLYLSVRNTSLPVEINGKYIPTSKEPKEDHGYGLPHIDFILNQLHAEYALSCEDGWFEFASEIPHD